MRKRSSSLLLHLLPGSGVIPSVEKLSDVYHVGPRSIRSDIEEINRYLSTIGQPPFHTDSLGMVKSGDGLDASAIRERLFAIGNISYRFSPEERQILLLAVIAVNDGYVTMESMADNLFVSRITVMSDMEFVKDWLEDHDGLSLTTKSSKGVRLESEGEGCLRDLLVDLFRRVVVKASDENVFLHIMTRELGFVHPLGRILDALRRYEMEHDILFPEESFLEIALCAFIAANRHSSGHSLSEGVPGSAKPAGSEILTDIISFLSASAGADMPPDEIAAVAAGHDMEALGGSSQKIIDIELYKIISYFLLKVGERFGWRLQHDQLLLESLHSHIKSMSNAVNMGFDFVREKEFQGEYWEILDEIEKHAFVLEKYLTRKLSEKMKLSIFIHICAALIRSRKYSAPLNIIVVCPGSMATGRLVEAQIRSHFDLAIREVVSIDRVVDIVGDIGDGVDFIVSTVPVDSVQCPVVIVQPILTRDDLDAIQKLAMRPGGVRDDAGRRKKRLLNLIGDVLDDADEKGQAAFAAALEALARKYLPASTENDGVGVTQLLDVDGILIADKGMGWMEAIRACGEPLRRAGRIERDYIDDMIANIHKYGPYIIIGGRIALAHAKPGINVVSEGLSMLLCREGIVFDDDARTAVHVMLCLSTVENGQYTRLLHEVVALGGSESFISEVLDAASPEDALAITIRHCRHSRGDRDPGSAPHSSSRRLSHDI